MQDDGLYALIRQTVEEMGYTALEIQLVRAKSKHTLKVVLYHSGHAVGSEDCSDVAEVLSRRLDIDDPIEKRYDLVVESPGLEREIKSISEYPCFLNKEFKVVPDPEIAPPFVGTLVDFTENVCLFSVQGQDVPLNVSQIRKARLHYDFQKALREARRNDH